MWNFDVENTHIIKKKFKPVVETHVPNFCLDYPPSDQEQNSKLNVTDRGYHFFKKLLVEFSSRNTWMKKKENGKAVSSKNEQNAAFFVLSVWRHTTSSAAVIRHVIQTKLGREYSNYCRKKRRLFLLFHKMGNIRMHSMHHRSYFSILIFLFQFYLEHLEQNRGKLAINGHFEQKEGQVSGELGIQNGMR